MFMSLVLRPNSSFCWFILFGGFHSTREFFTHMVTSPSPVKCCKFFLPIFGTDCHLAVRVL